MNLATTFLILGVIYFAISIILLIALLWWILFHYLKLKEQLEKIKSKLSLMISLKDLKKTPIIAGLLIPIIAFLLKKIGDNRKKKS